jgi:hypothetical protein
VGCWCILLCLKGKQLCTDPRITIFWPMFSRQFQLIWRDFQKVWPSSGHCVLPNS